MLQMGNRSMRLPYSSIMAALVNWWPVSSYPSGEWNSLAAGSNAIATPSIPVVWPAASMASTIRARTSSGRASSGVKPPSSPSPVDRCRSVRTPRQPMRLSMAE